MGGPHWGVGLNGARGQRRFACWPLPNRGGRSCWGMGPAGWIGSSCSGHCGHSGHSTIAVAVLLLYRICIALEHREDGEHLYTVNN